MIELDATKYIEYSKKDKDKYQPIGQQIFMYQSGLSVEFETMSEWFIPSDIPNDVIKSFWVQMEDKDNGVYYVEIKNPNYKSPSVK